jgi:anti-sigma regulatory factor (Ser/Thr protein kinase)
MLQTKDNERIRGELQASLDKEKIRNEEAEKNRKYYKDIISAVTGGKLQIFEKEELESILDEGKPLGSMVLAASADVGRARYEILDILEKIGFDAGRREDLILCVSEAATNVIRHAKEGELRVRLLEDRIRVWVIDFGEGIDFSNLPKIALMRGFSTKISLGCGYTLMMELLDRVCLSSDKGGTTLVLEMLLTPPSMEENIKELLNRWNG